MANTYTQIHLQLVFCVQNRECLIHVKWKEELYRYMTGIIQNSGHKVLQINGMPDHVHILIGMRPTEALSGLMKKLKGDSSEWINDKGFVSGKFRWQEGFGAFSYSKSDLPNVIRYIQNQEQHHAKKTLREEYLDILRRNEVEFDDRYVFHDV
jgi:putative transposase